VYFKRPCKAIKSSWPVCELLLEYCRAILQAPTVENHNRCWANDRGSKQVRCCWRRSRLNWDACCSRAIRSVLGWSCMYLELTHSTGIKATWVPQCKLNIWDSQVFLKFNMSQTHLNILQLLSLVSAVCKSLVPLIMYCANPTSVFSNRCVAICTYSDQDIFETSRWKQSERPPNLKKTICFVVLKFSPCLKNLTLNNWCLRVIPLIAVI